MDKIGNSKLILTDVHGPQVSHLQVHCSDPDVDPNSRMAYCNWFLGNVNIDPDFLAHFIMTDECAIDLR